MRTGNDDSMTRKLTATEAKAAILALLDEVAAGDEVEITKHVRTVAKLGPARPADRLIVATAPNHLVVSVRPAGTMGA